MTISRIGVHPSVGGEDDPETLREALADEDLTAVVLDDDPSDLDCDAVVTLRHREAFLDGDLRWVHLNAAGTDHVPLERYAARGIAVTNSSGIHAAAVGEHVLGLMLMLAHELHTFASNQRRRVWEWPDRDEKFTLEDESVCVIGLGGLGSGIAERADALGMRVVGVRRSAEPTAHLDELYTAGEYLRAIKDATFVVVALPLTAETDGLFDAEALATMRDDAFLVNVGRGEIVDEAALTDALTEGRLAGAGLDVFEEEPLPAESPLWDLEEAIVTPHRAGMFRGHYRAVADLVRENVGRLDAGERLRNRVV